MKTAQTFEWTFDALGTSWWIVTNDELVQSHKDELLEYVADFESAYSRFKPDSYIGKLNTSKVLLNPTPELRRMFEYALNMYTQTDGVFNISIGAALEKAGYGQKAQSDSRVSDNLLGDILLEPYAIRIAPWVRVDFGGFGKGWLVDALTSKITDLGYESVLVNGGGDVLAHGQVQELLIEHPLDVSLTIGSVQLKNESVSSSSNRKRVWRIASGEVASHIQPATKHTSDAVLSMHVRAKSALLADTLATVFLLVDHQTRITFAHKFSVDFMEVREDGTYWQTPKFGFQANV